MAGNGVTFVIPVLNEEGNIGPLLRRLRTSYPGSECVVVDGGSSDATVVEARREQATVHCSAPGRALQMNAGARLSTSPYLFFLHADTLPSITDGQLQICLQTQPQWGFFKVQLSGSPWLLRVVERAMNMRSRLSRVATGDQMIFIQRELFEKTGGYRPIPLMEDVEYCKRLRHIAAPMVVSQVVETSSRRWEQQGVVSTVIQMWCLRLAYFFGISPTRLKNYYRSA